MIKPLVLLTNDDGVQAPGILALHRAISRCFDTCIVAPDRNWSASGHSKTMHKPLRTAPTLLEDGAQAIQVSGSPSDCVALVVLGLTDRRPDLVISGINQGANVGQDLTYSGTVSAAMEAVISGIPGIAISLDSYEMSEFGVAADFAVELAKSVLAETQDAPLLLNVNVPALEREAIKGVEITRQGQRVYRDALVRRQDPRGRPYYWIGGDPPGGVEIKGTDIGALAQGIISVTPLLLDLTDISRMPLAESWSLSLDRC